MCPPWWTKAKENKPKEGTPMGLGVIAQNVSTAINGLIVSSVFPTFQNQGTPIEQNQPDQIYEFRNQTDPVTISSKARVLGLP